MFQPFELFDVTFEITEGNNIRNQRMQAPRMLIEQQFLQLIQQAANLQTPIKVKMSRIEQIYDNFDQKMVDREISVSFMNNAYLATRKEETNEV